MNPWKFLLSMNFQCKPHDRIYTIIYIICLPARAQTFTCFTNKRHFYSFRQTCTFLADWCHCGVRKCKYFLIQSSRRDQIFNLFLSRVYFVLVFMATLVRNKSFGSSVKSQVNRVKGNRFNRNGKSPYVLRVKNEHRSYQNSCQLNPYIKFWQRPDYA